MSTIPIFIPYLNRLDLLKKAVASVPKNRITAPFVMNNSGDQVPFQASYWTPEVPLTFAQTQNWMLKLAGQMEIPFYLFMHSDAEAEGDTVQRLIAMAQAFTIQKRKWGVIFTAYDALAAFNTHAFSEVGGWDTALEWYASDQDMYRRIKLAGYELIDSNLPVKHEPSQTIKADSSIRRKVDLMFPCRQAYYRAKWGGEAGKEVFTVPFDGKEY